MNIIILLGKKEKEVMKFLYDNDNEFIKYYIYIKFIIFIYLNKMI